MSPITLLLFSAPQTQERTNLDGYLVLICAYNGDTTSALQIPTIHIFKPLRFGNKKEQMEYYELVRNVKKVCSTVREISQTITEIYEYL